MTKLYRVAKKIEKLWLKTAEVLPEGSSSEPANFRTDLAKLASLTLGQLKTTDSDFDVVESARIFEATRTEGDNFKLFVHLDVEDADTAYELNVERKSGNTLKAGYMITYNFIQAFKANLKSKFSNMTFDVEILFFAAP